MMSRTRNEQPASDAAALRALMVLEHAADELTLLAEERIRAAGTATQGLDPTLQAEFETRVHAHHAALLMMAVRFRQFAAEHVSEAATVRHFNQEVETLTNASPHRHAN